MGLLEGWFELDQDHTVAMLVLFETPAGFALFSVDDEKKISSVDDVTKAFATANSAKKLVKLKAFKKFEDTEEALAAASALIEGTTIDKGLKNFLKKNVGSEKLAVIDAKFGNLLKDTAKVACVFDDTIAELFRGIRTHLNDLVEGFDQAALKSMSVGLAHSLARYKLKFSPDKVDVMIIQAIGLLDDIMKERNTYSMRLREWFGWHFPELGKIVTDTVMYAKALKKMGRRSNAKDLNFGDILPEELENEVKAASIISMGTDISDTDVLNIGYLADQVITISEYCDQLNEYLKNRMNAIAPNLTVMVGELVGARLIAHAGSLINLAKQPASTVQILGAEKALFRALKTKKETPKYGLIYRASMVGQATTKNKGKISRVLAAKTALSVRVDALGESSEPTIAVNDLLKVQERLRRMEGGAPPTRLSGTGKSKANGTASYNQPRVATFNTSNDAVMAEVEPEKKKRKKKDEENVNGEPQQAEETKPEKKKKKEKAPEPEPEPEPEVEAAKPEKKKKKKEKAPEPEPEPEPEQEPPKAEKKKKKSEPEPEPEPEPAKSEKKKKKKEAEPQPEIESEPEEAESSKKRKTDDGAEEKKKKKKK
eukprot:c2336_g1_i1.p1 GENE.c2336_g1_i1~~c2336_g1_i1.p1  ORF type:complete len:598 (-),score=178.20 c2336_g1_i1:74-1867(-)